MRSATAVDAMPGAGGGASAHRLDPVERRARPRSAGAGLRQLGELLFGKGRLVSIVPGLIWIVAGSWWMLAISQRLRIVG